MTLVTGEVYDVELPPPAPIPYARLEFVNVETGEMYVTSTDEEGKFSIDLPPAEYTVRMKSQVHRPVTFRLTVRERPVTVRIPTHKVIL